MGQGRLNQTTSGTELARADSHSAPIGVSTLPAATTVDAAATVPVAQINRFLGISKRALDLILSVLAILLLVPLMLLIAIVIKLDSPGPTLYRSRRIGRNGEPFEMLKFRTMVADADRKRNGLRHLNEAPDGLFKISDDPRVTRLGRLLRRLCLDELPQLLQVVTGTMSLVGPRPLPPEEDALIAGAGLRMHARPGVTGPWQLAGSWRVPLSEMVELDDEYLVNWSIWADVKMIARTGAYIVRRPGV